MSTKLSNNWRLHVPLLVCGTLLSLTGCGPSFEQLRQEGQKELAAGNWAAARGMFEDAFRVVPEHAENMHDLGVCSMMIARHYIEDRDEPATKREIDRAIWSFERSTKAHPGYRPALIGKNRAEELKGQFDAALRTADWAANYVGPSAEQFLWLGAEYEERGDLDMAQLRYKQAQLMEPKNPKVFAALGRVQLHAGNKAGAARALHQALDLDPANKEASDLLREMGEAVPGVDTGP
jgi:Flp pilus assembly protein TadD